MELGIILLVVILLLIFRDVIFKIITGKKSLFKSKKVINKEYNLKNYLDKNIYIDVLDTDVKILYHEELDMINIKTSYLSEEFPYLVKYDEDNNISIIKNNKENFTQVGHSGRILIKVPSKNSINSLNLKVKNGDIEFYDVDIDNLIIDAQTGTVKIESLKAKNIEISKLNGDVSLNFVNTINLNLNIKDGNGDFVDVYGENITSNVVNGDFIFANSLELEYEIKSLNVNTVNGKQKLNVNANAINQIK